MTMSSADVAIVTADSAVEHHSYVDWAAVIGGIVLASAISLVLLTFGSAIGLSFTSFRSSEGVAPVWVAVAAASWLLWVQISSFMAGGYITGRLRRRFYDSNSHESDVRDGAHGLLVWAGALVIGAVIAVGGLGSAINAIGSTAATLTNAASNAAGDAAGALDPNAYFVDTLFRAPAPSDAAPATTPAAPAADTSSGNTVMTPAPATTAAASAVPDNSNAKAETGRILATAGMNGTVSDTDKAYLAQLVSSNTGLSSADASTRVDQVLAAVDEAKAKAADAAETARRTGVLAAFLAAASLLVSAVGAYWAASMGGRHRDEGTVFADVFRRY